MNEKNRAKFPSGLFFATDRVAGKKMPG